MLYSSVVCQVEELPSFHITAPVSQERMVSVEVSEHVYRYVSSEEGNEIWDGHVVPRRRLVKSGYNDFSCGSMYFCGEDVGDEVIYYFMLYSMFYGYCRAVGGGVGLIFLMYCVSVDLQLFVIFHAMASNMPSRSIVLYVLVISNLLALPS